MLNLVTSYLFYKLTLFVAISEEEASKSFLFFSELWFDRTLAGFLVKAFCLLVVSVSAGELKTDILLKLSFYCFPLLE